MYRLPDKDTRLILVKNPPSDPSERKILWRVREPGSPNTITGDPIANGATVRISLTPGGDQCFQLPAGNWSALVADGYRYNDSDLSEGAVRSAYIRRLTPDGIRNLILKAGDVGRGRIRARGKGANLDLPPFLTPPLRVQLQRTDASQCWEATFSIARRNDGTRFIARSD